MVKSDGAVLAAAAPAKVRAGCWVDAVGMHVLRDRVGLFVVGRMVRVGARFVCFFLIRD